MNINKHDMSDDELDRLFSESAEKMEFDFDADSWAKMSQKLDAAAPPPSSSRGINPWFKRSLLLLIGLMAFVGGYFLLKPSANQSKETLISANKKAENEQTEIDSKKYVETSKVDTNNLNSDKKASETTENIEPSNTNDVSKEPVVLEKKEEISLEKTNELLESENRKTLENRRKEGKNKHIFVNNNEETVFVQNAKTRSSSNKNKQIEINKFANTKSEKETNQTQIFNRSEIEAQNNISQANNIEPTRLTLKNLDLLSPKGTFVKSSISLPVIAFENPQTESSVLPKSTPQSFKKGLYFRFGISPDMSLVTMDELTKFGSNLAFLLEYRFNNRLSIQGGVLRSMKYYDAYPESYEFPYNWGYPPKITDINATCKMLDIPLNIRYDISQKKLSRVFVSAGATSYIMLNEKYVYNYENPSDPKIKWKSWEGKTGPYYLGVLNFSMGYEYQLFRKLSVQAEPFFKTPITNVGFGKVHLSTFGILVSAKYPISIRK